MIVTSYSPEETERIAYDFAKQLPGGSRVGLSGPLGAGKTCFMQGVGRALGVLDNMPLTSPTFSIMNEYPLPSGGVLYHLDLYRLETWNSFLEIDGLALLTALDPCSFIFIEWAERYAEMIAYLDGLVHIEEIAHSEARKIIIERRSSSWTLEFAKK